MEQKKKTFLETGLYGGSKTFALELTLKTLEDARGAIEYETDGMFDKIDILTVSFMNMHICFKSSEYQKELNDLNNCLDYINHIGDMLTKDEIMRTLEMIYLDLVAISKTDYDKKQSDSHVEYYDWVDEIDERDLPF